MILETALGIALILAIALPFGSLISYATYAARDLASVQSAARTAARSEAATSSDAGVIFTCGNAATATTDPCPSPLLRGTYVAASKDTVVPLPFGIELRTNERAVARVE
jgi:hypothetical protein